MVYFQTRHFIFINLYVPQFVIHERIQMNRSVHSNTYKQVLKVLRIRCVVRLGKLGGVKSEVSWSLFLTVDFIIL